MRADAKERVLVTTLTKRTAEELTDYLREIGINVAYLHSEIDAILVVKLGGMAKRLSHLPFAVASVVIGISGIIARRSGAARIGVVRELRESKIG